MLRNAGRSVIQSIPSFSKGQRVWQSTAAEQQLEDLIKGQLSQPKVVKVSDTSGGCGTMFTIDVEAGDFRGISIVKQHQLVTKALGPEIKKWHGFTLNTRAPE